MWWKNSTKRINGQNRHTKSIDERKLFDWLGAGYNNDDDDITFFGEIHRDSEIIDGREILILSR